VNTTPLRIIVMAKAPRPGLAKTRLAAVLGDASAARLAARMLRHAVAQAVQAGCGAVELRVTPDADDEHIVALAREHSLPVVLQGDGDLGDRMARALADGIAAHGAALVMGSDAPALDAAVLRQAAQALATHDAVLVPALDGGFVLLGLRRCPAGLLSGLHWSHAQVLRDTAARMAEHGLSAKTLPALADIDTPDDLRHLPSGWLDSHD
jgi:rSAM/selenodomain-associated transferase 1